MNNALWSLLDAATENNKSIYSKRETKEVCLELSGEENVTDEIPKNYIFVCQVINENEI